jgi:exopolysaccharide biosynthesis polyprenyl glycosylphosphotransferase
MRPDSYERYPAPRRDPVPPGCSGAPEPMPSHPAMTRPGLAPSAPAPLGVGGSRASRLVPAAVLPAVDVAALAAAAAACAAGLAGGAGPRAAAVAFYALAVLVVGSVTGLHRLRITLRASDQVGRILAATLAPAVVVASAGLLAPGRFAAGSVVRLAVASAIAILAGRLAASAGLRAARRRGALAEPALIVGSGTFGAHLAGQIREHPELGLRVMGFLDDAAPRRDLAEPTLGRPRDLARVVGELGIRRVLICFGEDRDEDLVPVLRAAGRLPADVCVVPRLHELGLGVPRASLDEIWGVPLIPLRRRGAGPAGRALKRAFDITVSAVLLAAAAPLLLALGTVIRWQTGRSALFRQVRVTGAGQQSTIWKLRTITEPPGASAWSVDPARCSPLGRWLRATHLDELPQLINVLRGDMSLVGPRPERGYFAADFARHIPRYADRDRMRAGLTGWAQVHGLHGDTSIAERSRFDNAYIEYWSPWLDLVILARTIGSAVAGLGASR